jgi:hypothetical protein
MRSSVSVPVSWTAVGTAVRTVWTSDIVTIVGAAALPAGLHGMERKNIILLAITRRV